MKEKLLQLSPIFAPILLLPMILLSACDSGLQTEVKWAYIRSSYGSGSKILQQEKLKEQDEISLWFIVNERKESDKYKTITTGEYIYNSSNSHIQAVWQVSEGVYTI